jgi:tetratricopeptide (TPR) repeat protein
MLGAKQFDEVIEHAHRILEREPNFAPGYITSALAYTEKGQFDQAVEAIEKAAKIRSDPTMKALAAHVHGAKGNRSTAEKLLAELKVISSSRYVCAYEVAHAQLKLGNKKQAYEWLEKGKRERADCMVWLLHEPWMDPLRNDRQYRELMDYMGLSTGKAGQKP